MAWGHLNITDEARNALRELIVRYGVPDPVIRLGLQSRDLTLHADVNAAVIGGAGGERVRELIRQHNPEVLDAIARNDFFLSAWVVSAKHPSARRLVRSDEFAFSFMSGPLLLMLAPFLAHRYRLDVAEEGFELTTTAGRVVLPLRGAGRM